MNRFRLVALAVVLTSVFWLVIGALWSMHQPDGDLGGTAHPAMPPVAKTSGTPLVTDGSPLPGSVDSYLLIPVAGVRADDLVDSFARSDGMEIPAPQGMPVIAAAPGIVEKLSVSTDGGNSIHVRSPDRTRIYHYARLGAYAPGLLEGQVIGAGEQLGSVGAAAGKRPHLRFEVLAIMPDQDLSGDTRPLNPYPLLTGRENQSR